MRKPSSAISIGDLIYIGYLIVFFVAGQGKADNFRYEANDSLSIDQR